MKSILWNFTIHPKSQKQTLIDKNYVVIQITKKFKKHNI